MRSVLSIVLLLAAYSLPAQSVNLANDPNKPVLTQPKSNAQMLKQSQPVTLPHSDTASLNRKFNTSSNTSGTANNSYMNANPQPMNSQSQQYNIGNTKATNSIYYDNSGKIQGSGTTLEFGKKK